MEFDIRHFVPQFIMQDVNGAALACAMERGLQKMTEIVADGVQTVLNIEAMPAWRLDELAWEYNITWYDYNAEISHKREQIRGAMDYYTRLGTAAAVRRAISDVYGAGHIEEWFQYGGTPYHFRVYTTNVTVLQENRERFLHLLSQVKNARSVLENVIYNGASSAARIYAATKCVGLAASSAGTAKNYYKER